MPDQPQTNTAALPYGPVVSSAHLAAGASPALSEFEFGLILVSHAFNRWIVRCMAAAGYGKLSALDVLVLHTINHRHKSKTLADICLVLNVEDTHNVNYALKKLTLLGLVKSAKSGKVKAVTISAKGEDACRTYHEIREGLLVRAVKSVGLNEAALSEVAGTMRALSGHYDQAARSAATL